MNKSCVYVWVNVTVQVIGDVAEPFKTVLNGSATVDSSHGGYPSAEGLQAIANSLTNGVTGLGTQEYSVWLEKQDGKLNLGHLEVVDD